MRTRVKICGITREQDALAAAELGADAIGLVFYAPSPRSVTIKQARSIIHNLPPFISVVALFVDATEGEIQCVLDALPIDLLQFHGKEAPQACASYGTPFIKAVRMREGIDLSEARNNYSEAAGLLLDTYKPGVVGGTGIAFDWTRIPPTMARRIILAGGLNPESVESAVRRIRPYAVDVSGGVEKGKGIKDRAKMAAFFNGVKRGKEG